MRTEAIARLSEAMHREADALWEKLEQITQQDMIRPQDVVDLVARPVGLLTGWAEMLDWHVTHDHEGEASGL